MTVDSRLNQPTASELNRLFLTDSPDSAEYYRQVLGHAHEVITREFARLNHPYSGESPQALAATIAPPVGEGMVVGGVADTDLHQLIDTVGEQVLRHAIVVTHPACIAHLHCPPLIPALVAEAMISATNQSMDSWDQSTSATIVEQQVIDWLCAKVGYARSGDGVLTSGGTQSNLMGILLARDHYVSKTFGWSVQQRGLPPEADKLRILCSKVAHFTVRQSAALLGLGEQCVIVVDTDANQRLNTRQLADTIAKLDSDGLHPFLVVATAGTTDFGSIDPLLDIATIAHKSGLWLHVDAAYGGALLLSERHKAKLDGLELADSATIDFHKLFYQPISCGAFLVQDAHHFELIRLHAAYLNPEDDDEDGVPNLVTKSIQTTRRFDALKVYLTLQSIGEAGIASLIDYTIELTSATADRIASGDGLELFNRPEMNAVVFRYVPSAAGPEDDDGIARSNRINRHIRNTLFLTGEAVIARTQLGPYACLKFTLLNPRTTVAQMEALLARIVELGQEAERLG